MTTTAKGIPELSASAFIKDGPTDINAALTAVDGLLDVRAYAEVNTSESRNNATPGDLTTPGPSVTVTMPTNGLVAIYAAVAVTVSLGVSGDVDIAEDGTVLASIINASASGTYYTVPGSTDGTSAKGSAGWIVFPSPAGSHTYKLTYHSAGGSATFATRRLWARVLPF